MFISIICRAVKAWNKACIKNLQVLDWTSANYLSSTYILGCYLRSFISPCPHTHTQNGQISSMLVYKYLVSFDLKLLQSLFSGLYWYVIKLHLQKQV